MVNDNYDRVMIECRVINSRFIKNEHLSNIIEKHDDFITRYPKLFQALKEGRINEVEYVLERFINAINENKVEEEGKNLAREVTKKYIEPIVKDKLSKSDYSLLQKELNKRY